MATIALGDNAAAHSVLVSHGTVDVIVKDGEGATVITTYDDLEALHEVARLFAEAHSKLSTVKIDDEGVDVPVEAIGQGDHVVVFDAYGKNPTIVEVVSVVVRTGQRGISYRDANGDTGKAEYLTGGQVCRIGPAKSPACL